MCALTCCYHWWTRILIVAQKVPEWHRRHRNYLKCLPTYLALPPNAEFIVLKAIHVDGMGICTDTDQITDNHRFAQPVSQPDCCTYTYSVITVRPSRIENPWSRHFVPNSWQVPHGQRKSVRD